MIVSTLIKYVVPLYIPTYVAAGNVRHVAQDAGIGRKQAEVHHSHDHTGCRRRYMRGVGDQWGVLIDFFVCILSST